MRSTSKQEYTGPYKKPDNYCVINEEDPSLHPVYIKMPECPPLKEIDGYGLNPSSQKFVKQVMPSRLFEVVNQFDTIDEVWEELENNGKYYQEEIAWMKLQIYRRFNGYWCFINGKPTYFCGWNYMYLNFWYFMDANLPDYRDRNRRYFHAMQYAYTATMMPSYDSTGMIMYEEQLVNGEMAMVPVTKELGSRILFGILYPKNRRDGATNMCLCAEYLETITRIGVVSGIISMSGKAAKDHFDEILKPGWQGMPFFFKPIHDGFDNPEDAIKFFGPKRKGGKAKAQKQLGSKITFSDTAQSTGYDRNKIFFMLVDEAGKTVEANVDSRHQILKNCVSQGNGSVIGGFMMLPSTVGEMKGKGGANYFSLAQKSHWEKRGERTGQTASGLMNVFFKSEEGLEGFVDPYGDSVILDPTPTQIRAAHQEKNWQDKYKYAVLGIGSRQYLEERRKAFLDAGDMDSYNEEVRLFPQNFGEAFRTEDEDVGFNLIKLNNQIDELKFTFKNRVRRGNFEWENNIRDSKVIWKDDENGKFYLSKILLDHESNQKYTDNGIWYPLNPKFTSSADTFAYGKKSEKRAMSDGGGAVFWDYDSIIDANTDISHWQSNRFVCTYRHRPKDLDEYCEDMLMMSVYFGAMMYPEINRRDVWKYFDDRGYAGYMKYDIDFKTGKFKENPGFTSLGDSKQELFNCVRDYVEKHIHREVHLDLLMEFKQIKGIEDMTHWDLFTAGAGAIKGSKSKHSEMIKINSQSINVASYFEKRY